MGIIEAGNKYVKNVSKWNHLVKLGLNVMVVNLTLHREGYDNYGHEGVIFETEKHYCQEFIMKGLNNPQTSFVLFKKKVIIRLKQIVMKDFNGKEPVRLPIIIKCFKSGNNYCYQILYTLDEENIDKIIDNMLNHKFKDIYDLFTKGSELEGWRY